MVHEWRPEYDALLEQAAAMRACSYAPYSHFAVGAALVGRNGTIYTGCNVENAAYGPSNCAERTAVFKAVSEGCREFSMIAIAGAPDTKKGSEFCTPCGVCRQVLREFTDPEEFLILCGEIHEDGSMGRRQVFTLEELLPESFKL